MKNLTSKAQIRGHVEAAGEYRIDEPTAVVTYEGNASPGSLTSEAKWLIKRVSQQSTQTVEEYAGNGDFNQVWDNRASLFGAIPFSATYSTIFDGVNDYVDLGNNFNNERTDSWTRSFWFRPRALSANMTLYSRKTGGGVGITIQVFANGRVNVDLRNTNSTNQLNVSGPQSAIIPATWYNIVVSYDGTSLATGLKIYLNGTLQTNTVVANTLTSSILSNGVTAQMGMLQSTTYLDGHLDEVSFWGSVLSQADVDSIFNSDTPGNLANHASYANLLSWWRMGDVDVYPTISDQKGSAHGTMTNMTVASFVAVAP